MKKVKKPVAQPVKVARKRNRISVDLTDKQMRAFKKLSKMYGLSNSEIIRDCLERYGWI